MAAFETSACLMWDFQWEYLPLLSFGEQQCLCSHKLAVTFFFLNFKWLIYPHTRHVPQQLRVDTQETKRWHEEARVSKARLPWAFDCYSDSAGCAADKDPLWSWFIVGLRLSDSCGLFRCSWLTVAIRRRYQLSDVICDHVGDFWCCCLIWYLSMEHRDVPQN